MVQIELEGKTSYLLFYENGDKGIGWKRATKNIDADVRYRVCAYTSMKERWKGDLLDVFLQTVGLI